MIDNFEQVYTIIRNKSGVGEFYFLQILRRRKDNPEQERDMIVMYVFYIENAEALLKMKPAIVNMCEVNNARAYFHLNKRDERKVALETLRLISASIASQQWNIRNSYNSACGKFNSDKEKKWVVDVDTKEWDEINEVMDAIKDCRPKGDKLIGVLPTKNGVHLICTPFHVEEFRKKYTKKLDIHKDNPTILYHP